MGKVFQNRFSDLQPFSETYPAYSFLFLMEPLAEKTSETESRFGRFYNVCSFSYAFGDMPKCFRKALLKA